MTTAERMRLWAMLGLGSLLAMGGFAGSRALGAALGRVIWLTVPSRRRMATSNIADCLGLPAQQAARIAKNSFEHTGRSFLELLLTHRFGFDFTHLRMEPEDSLLRLRACTRPIVAATAHLGAWELLASLLGELYQERPRLVVVRKYSDAAAHAFIERRRQARGALMVGHRNAASTVLRALRKNGLAAFLVDHNAKRQEAVFLPFLNKEAAVNIGPAILAVRGKALLWPVALVREGKGYVFKTQEPLDTATLEGSMEERILAAAKFYTKATEKFVLETPEQWFWMHNRWKTKPKKQAGAQQAAIQPHSEGMA